MRSEGSAFLDRTGRVIAADDGFRSCLGLPAGDATPSLRARAESDPPLRALLAGDGPDVARVGPADAPLDVGRSEADGGLFLTVRPAAGLAAPPLEHAMHSLALARIAGGVAHDVKNPLNAMALQLALLGDKLGGAGESIADACAGNLTSLKTQIGRVNDVVRRLADATDPAGGAAFDLGLLAGDVAGLFGHEARRRGVALSCEATPATVHARGDAARTARVLLGLVWRGLSRPAAGDRLVVRAACEGDEALAVLEHAGEADPALGWMIGIADAAARAMGGRFSAARSGPAERLELRLRRERAG